MTITLPKIVWMVVAASLLAGCGQGTFAKKVRLALRAQTQQDRSDIVNARRLAYVDSRPELSTETRQRILDGKAWVGMSEEQCRASWGDPIRVNRRTSKYGVRQQYVYPFNQYIYFRDGKLTSISK